MKTKWQQAIVSLFKKQTPFSAQIKELTGLSPKNENIYKQALRHASSASYSKKNPHHSNERLEFLGDSILGASVSAYIFNKFPNKQEGQLTELRASIVNRTNLNEVALKLGIPSLLEFDKKVLKSITGSIPGNALEAIVGAIFIDHGYAAAEKFVVSKILSSSQKEITVETSINYKSRLIEWGQKQRITISFTTFEDGGFDHERQFSAIAIVNENEAGRGKGSSKKKAEQEAAKMACISIGI